jgi:hypothetical protein
MSAEKNRRIGARLRKERKVRIGTVRQMAEALRDAASERERQRLPKLEDLMRMIRNWEAGTKWGVSERYRLLYAKAFGLEEEQLFDDGAGSPPAIDDPWDALNGALQGALIAPGGALRPPILTLIDSTRDQIEQGFAISTIPVSHIDDLEMTVADRSADCVIAPPAEMVCRLTLDLVEIQRFAVTRQPHRVQRRLSSLVGQLAALIGVEMMVLGRVREANAWHGTALAAADDASDDVLGAQAQALHATIPLYFGDPREGARLARAARRRAGLGAAPHVAYSLAPALEALALAQLGNARASEESLRAARTAFDTLSGGQRAETVFGFSERRFSFYEVRALAEIAQHEPDQRRLGRALEAQPRALAMYPPDVVGDPTLIHLDRALCLVRSGQVDEGCALAGSTLVALPAEHRGRIFLRRGEAVLRAVPAARSSAAVREYADVLVALAQDDR